MSGAQNRADLRSQGQKRWIFATESVECVEDAADHPEQTRTGAAIGIVWDRWSAQSGLVPWPAVGLRFLRSHAKRPYRAKLDGNCGESGQRGNQLTGLVSMDYQWNQRFVLLARLEGTALAVPQMRQNKRWTLTTEGMVDRRKDLFKASQVVSSHEITTKFFVPSAPANAA
jgi:hypothetical protein